MPYLALFLPKYALYNILILSLVKKNLSSFSVSFFDHIDLFYLSFWQFIGFDPFLFTNVVYNVSNHLAGIIVIRLI